MAFFWSILGYKVAVSLHLFWNRQFYNYGIVLCVMLYYVHLNQQAIVALQEGFQRKVIRKPLASSTIRSITHLLLYNINQNPHPSTQSILNPQTQRNANKKERKSLLQNPTPYSILLTSTFGNVNQAIIIAPNNPIANGLTTQVPSL